MEISENKVFVFRFGYEGGDITIPVKADSKDEAVESMQKWMSRVQTELAMEFPRVSSPELAVTPEFMGAQVASATPAGSVPPEVLELRIDTLLASLGGKDLQDAARAETIKNWTGIDFTLGNYAKIVNKLELIATGQDVNEPKKPKKKTDG